MSFRPKQYGLILPNTTKPKADVSKAKDLFDDGDSDQELSEDAAKASLSKQVQSQGLRSFHQKQVQDQYAAALATDSSIFDYDAAWEELNQKREQVKAVKEERKPKYIAALKQKAEERKIEQERVMIRKIQREREKEGEEFGDKEQFVTKAYMEKLLEEKRRQEEERAQIAAEDITKKKDMRAFYQNLLTNNVAYGTAVTEKLSEVRSSKSIPTPSSSTKPPSDSALPRKQASPVTTTSEKTSKGDHIQPSPVSPPSISPSREQEEKQPQPPPAVPVSPASTASAAAAKPQPTVADRSAAVASARERYLARKRQREEEPAESQD